MKKLINYKNGKETFWSSWQKFILIPLVIKPLTAFAKLTARIMTRTGKGFKINSGEARYGTRYKMKGVGAPLKAE